MSTTAERRTAELIELVTNRGWEIEDKMYGDSRNVSLSSPTMERGDTGEEWAEYFSVYLHHGQLQSCHYSALGSGPDQEWDVQIFNRRVSLTEALRLADC